MAFRFGKLYLAIAAVLVSLVLPSNLTTSAQTSANNGVVQPNDIVALLAFSLMKKDLPEGTRPNSSFRTSKDQLRILRHFAEIEGIPVPADMRLDNPKSWEPVLAAVRAKDYAIAPPGKSPHEDENKIVIDFGGASLSEIEKGCLKAKNRGLIEIYNTILERKNNAFHIEFGLKAMALSFLGLDPQLVKSNEDDQTLKKNIVSEMREKAKSEADPGKRAERLKNLQETPGLVDFGDPAYLALQSEIEQNQREADQLITDREKRDALKAISDAREQSDWMTAKDLAGKFSSKFKDATNLVSAIEAEELFQTAVEKAFGSDPPMQCDECYDALELANQALNILNNATPKLSSNAETKVQIVLDNRVKRCRSQFILRVVLFTVVSLGVLVGLFFAFRPGKLILFCEDGDQHGESFALDQPEIIIGSLGEPDGEAQIVINDRKRKISRNHCVVKQNGRRYYLKDLSANGTLVNGRKLNASEYHELKKGDEISLAGAATLIVRRQ